MLAASKLPATTPRCCWRSINRLGEIGADVSIVANPPSGGYQTVELNVSLVSGGSFL
jgi:hypothetical protein